MSDKSVSSPEEQGLKKSVQLLFIYTVATGSIFTYVSYWDSVFYSYCGPGTFLAFALMTLAILPVALVYSELAPLFRTAGGELIYNTVGMNKHMGFFASWLIMAAWISVPPAVVMAMMTWISRTFHLNLSFQTIMILGIVILLIYFLMSLQDINFLVKAQAFCLFANIGSALITAIVLLFSGHWHLANFANMFQTNVTPQAGIPGWVIGMALLITPFFGFETVPQMVEEGDFPIKNAKKAIMGSVITCGTIYAFFFFAVAGLDNFSHLLTTDSSNGFLTIIAMQKILGWTFWPFIYGVISIFLGMSASLLGFWMSTVRMLYSMSSRNFLPPVFSKVNKHHQPILPNIFMLAISITFVVLENAGTFMKDFFNLMAFGCACAYALTMISAMLIHKKHPEWKSPNAVKGGNAFRLLALVIAVAIAYFCTLGQGIGSWISFAVYMGVGVLLWAWMVIFRWRKSSVKIVTPDGEQEY